MRSLFFTNGRTVPGNGFREKLTCPGKPKGFDMSVLQFSPKSYNPALKILTDDGDLIL